MTTEKTYTLSMETYTLDLFTGEIEKDKKEIHNCYIYKDGPTYKDIWLATKDEYPDIEPITTTDDGEKIYLLKNWLKECSNLRTEKGYIILVLFDNDYVQKSKEKLSTIKDELNSSLDGFIDSIKGFQSYIKNKIKK